MRAGCRITFSTCHLIPMLSTGRLQKAEPRVMLGPSLQRWSLLLYRSHAPSQFTVYVPAEPAASQLRREVCLELTSYDHRRAHFLAMCMKLVYERPACIEDIAQSR